MHVTIEYAKQHWKLLTGAFVGILLLLYLAKHGAQASQSTDSSSGTGSPSQYAATSAAADLANNNANAAISIAAYQAGVQDNAIAANLQASLADTAAKLSATNLQTRADVVKTLDTNSATVTMQSIVSSERVQETRIQGNTLLGLERSKDSVQKQVLSNVNNQIFAMFSGSKHFGSDITAFAPIIALETGQGYAAGDLGNANAAVKIGTSTGATVSKITKAATGLLGAFFG